MLFILFARQNQKSSRADIINGSFKDYHDFNNSKKIYLREIYEKTTDIVAAQTFNSCFFATAIGRSFDNGQI